MNILYIGHRDPITTSRHRADALRRLGHTVNIEDPYEALGGALRGRTRGALHYRSGYRLLQPASRRWVESLLHKHAGWPDVVWVDQCELLGHTAATALREFACPLILYAIDDPTGGRDGRRFDSLRAALPAYDLCVVVREENIAECYALGARNVLRVWRSYDEIRHAPFDTVDSIPPEFRSEVAFVGTWMRGEGRDDFMLGLIERGIDVAIWGDRWHKAPGWRRLQAHWRGPALGGRDYVAAIQGAKITLGLLSKGNRDLHTTRSAEIPYAGGLLCAQRTDEHLFMYREGEEAVFWSDVRECAAICRALLADSGRRERIRQAGMARVRAAGYGNEAICREILERLTLSDAMHATVAP